MLVLASAGCYYTAPPAQPPPVPPPPPPHDPEHDVASDPWATPPPDDGPPNAGTRPPPAPPPPPNAKRICETHKRKPLAASAIPPVPPSPPTRSRVTETSHWDTNVQAARCTIIRDQRTGTITVTYHPRCCPSPDPRVQNQPCPGPQTSTQQGPVLLVENAELAADGTVLGSRTFWTGVEPDREPQPYCGRLPEGVRAVGDARVVRGLARQLATMAELEAASIPAFDRLARELAAHGAPAALVDRAYAAMHDEIHHAELMARLACDHGAAPRTIEVADLPLRTLEAIATENAVEGCVREAYGALVATYQAERAADHLRDVLAIIAHDERQHAALAEDVHAWLLARLDDAARTRVTDARASATTALRADLWAMPMCEELGTPAPGHAVAMFDAYFAT